VQDGEAESLREEMVPLRDIRGLLSAHAGFRVIPVRQHPLRNRRRSAIGRLIKAVRMLRFGAEFDGKVTLLSYQVQRNEGRKIVLDLCWHAARIPDGLVAFIHFLDEKDEIRFQGDYPFDGQTRNAFGMLFWRREIRVPSEVPDGVYRVRLGTWLPKSTRHLPLTRFRGCDRESVEWCRNAVLLPTVNV